MMESIRNLGVIIGIIVGVLAIMISILTLIERCEKVSLKNRLEPPKIQYLKYSAKKAFDDFFPDFKKNNPDLSQFVRDINNNETEASNSNTTNAVYSEEGKNGSELFCETFPERCKTK